MLSSRRGGGDGSLPCNRQSRGPPLYNLPGPGSPRGGRALPRYSRRVGASAHPMAGHAPHHPWWRRVYRRWWTVDASPQADRPCSDCCQAGPQTRPDHGRAEEFLSGRVPGPSMGWDGKAGWLRQPGEVARAAAAPCVEPQHRRQPTRFQGAKTSWVGDVVLASTPMEVSASYPTQRDASSRAPGDKLVYCPGMAALVRVVPSGKALPGSKSAAFTSALSLASRKEIRFSLPFDCTTTDWRTAPDWGSATR